MLHIDRNTFRNIFINHWAFFLIRYPSYLKPHIMDVVNKMLGCGKESGGYSEFSCFDCGRDVRRIAFTCKSSFCLSCSKVYTEKFVTKVSKSLHPGLRYRHIILTVPDKLRPSFYSNRFTCEILTQFMSCGYKCLEDVVCKAVKRKVKIGAIVVVQTFGRSGHFNPHLHVIMTSGGIDEATGKWVELGYFPYEILHKKWQYYLFKMLKEVSPTSKMRSLIHELYKAYPKGLVAHVTKGKVPEQCSGLARYLAKYVASPPIAISRILSYKDSKVTYWYKDHQTGKEVVTVDVMTFIGRMVQHILPKGFKRIRYYGLQATTNAKQCKELITKGLLRVGRSIKGTYEIVAFKKYRERYRDTTGRDPLICKFCGSEMTLARVWLPKYGTIFDEWEELKAGKYGKATDRDDTATGRDRHPLRPTAEGVPLPLSLLWD